MTCYAVNLSYASSALFSLNHDLELKLELAHARNQYGRIFRQVIHITNLIKSEDKGTHFPVIIRIFVPKFNNTLRRMIEIGLKHTSELTVTDTVTAIQMGSGDMPVNP